MSEATNKTADAKRKSAATAAKTVDESATKPAAEAKPDAAVKVDETKSNESTPTTPSTGEADKPEQSDAEKADSKTEGKQSDGELNQELDSVRPSNTDLGNSTAGKNDVASSGAGSDDADNGASNSARSATLGEQFKGAFVVTAKSDAGFWRAGRKFARLEKTLVLVLGEDESGIDDVEIVGYESSQVVCLSVEKAKRVHSEKNLVVTEIDLDELKVK